MRSYGEVTVLLSRTIFLFIIFRNVGYTEKDPRLLYLVRHCTRRHCLLSPGETSPNIQSPASCSGFRGDVQPSQMSGSDDDDGDLYRAFPQTEGRLQRKTITMRKANNQNQILASKQEEEWWRRSVQMFRRVQRRCNLNKGRVEQ